jgi:hypothetical protein
VRGGRARLVGRGERGQGENAAHQEELHFAVPALPAADPDTRIVRGAQT